MCVCVGGGGITIVSGPGGVVRTPRPPAPPGYGPAKVIVIIISRPIFT